MTCLLGYDVFRKIIDDVFIGGMKYLVKIIDDVAVDKLDMSTIHNC